MGYADRGVNDVIRDQFGRTDGAPIPGGCDYCDAYQTRDGTFWISDHAVNALERQLALERQQTVASMREMGAAS